MDDIEKDLEDITKEFFGGGKAEIKQPLKEKIPEGVYRLPLKVGKVGQPLDDGNAPWIIGTFVEGYVNKTHPNFHRGIDQAGPRGVPVFPIAPGTVVEVREYPKGGKTCKILHNPDGLTSYYAHLDNIRVAVGQEVNWDTPIASNSDTGNAKTFGTAPHVHLEVKDSKGKHLDPMSVIGKKVGSFKTASFHLDYLLRLAHHLED